MPIASKHIRQPVPTEQSVETGCFFVIKKEHKEMANTQERRERMLRLLGLRERWKVGELAREFGVTERTILRDVEQLSLTKPICTEPGRHGGVWLTERLMRPMLTIRETAALYRALTVLEAEDANTGMLQLSLTEARPHTTLLLRSTTSEREKQLI